MRKGTLYLFVISNVVLSSPARAQLLDAALDPGASDAGGPALVDDGGAGLAETLAEPAPDVAVAEAGEAVLLAGDQAESEEIAASEGEAMIVTAQRFEEDIQKSPVTVNAFSARNMEQRGATNLQDLSKFTPNMQLQQTNRPAGGGSAYAAYIRGIGTGDFQFPTDPGVGLYVDDVYIARTIGGLLSLDQDIERVEVVKGPQGTLYGRNTIGGALNVTTAKPRLAGGPTASALVRLGNYGRKDFSLYANTPLLTDRIGAKISLASFHSDGYGERILSGEKTNSEERLIVRTGLLFKLSQDLNVRVDGDYSRQDQKPPTGVMLRFAPSPMTRSKIDRYNRFAAPALNPGLGLPDDAVVDERWVSRNPYRGYGLQPQYDRYHIGGVSGRISYSPTTWLNIKSITGVRVVDSDIAVDGDQTPYSLQSSHTKLNDKQYSQELQFAGEAWEDRFTYLVGLYFFREDGRSRLDTQSFHGLWETVPLEMRMPSDGVDTLTRIGLQATSYAAFTQESLEVVRGLRLTVGGRINRDEKEYDYSVAWTERDGFQVPASSAEAAWTSFIPKAGIDWSPIEPLLVYATYSQGFKSGGFSVSNQASNPTPKYDPERVTAYELGFKSHWFEGRKLTFNAAGFYNDYEDIQLTVQTADPMTNMNVRTTQNAGRSRIKGFEAEFTAQPVRGLSFNGGLGYVDAKFDSLVAGARAFGFRVGDRVPQIPDWTFNVGAQYAFDVALGELTLRGDVAYKGEMYLTAVDPTSYQEAFALYSARLSFVPYAAEALELSLYGLNLSDQTYYIYRATPAATGQEIGIPGQPRVIFASLKYTY